MSDTQLHSPAWNVLKIMLMNLKMFVMQIYHLKSAEKHNESNDVDVVVDVEN